MDESDDRVNSRVPETQTQDPSTTLYPQRPLTDSVLPPARPETNVPQRGSQLLLQRRPISPRTIGKKGTLAQKGTPIMRLAGGAQQCCDVTLGGPGTCGLFPAERIRRGSDSVPSLCRSLKSEGIHLILSDYLIIMIPARLAPDGSSGFGSSCPRCGSRGLRVWKTLFYEVFM